MTTRQFLRWARLHERRARGGWARSPWLVAVIAAGALAAFVEWRANAAGLTSASKSWLAGTLVAFALAFLRVPFHLYWRADAALLAQLPIPGGALLDAALVRCVRAAAITTLVVVAGAAPLARDTHLFVHHALFAGVLGLAAAGFIPAVALWAATLVATNRHAGGARTIQIASALAGGNPAQAAAAASRSQPASSGAVLGALPGFASTVVFVVALIASPYLVGKATATDVAPYLGSIAAGSVLALVVVRASAARLMGTILRDVSALDRQRLAPLEIHPPTAIERAIASMLGDAALPYRKDARLVRRRYPMAFALGSLAFVVLAIIGLARPRDPAPWLVATLGGAALYALALAGRLRRPPIELPRLSSTLPITGSARVRAKLAWLAGWLVVFVVIPGAFALLAGCSHPHGPNESAAPPEVDRRPQPPDPLGAITSGATCNADADCSPTESCFAPDFSPRGGHRPECDHDADCSSRGDGWVCNGSSCSSGCKNDAGCSEGLECRHGHCSSYRCTDARAERCPQNHRCADSGDCKRMTCTADAQCDTGVCWSGSCYAQGGHCAPQDMCCPP